MTQRLLLTTILLLAFAARVCAGTVSGEVTSGKGKVSEMQGYVVAWLEGPPAGSPATATPTMSQSGVQFSPRVLTVMAGQTVSFPNADDVAHNVFSLSSAKKFKLGIYPKGDTREVTFEKPGVIDLFCSIHRHMHAVIIVTPNQYVAQTELGKPFKIENVPPGDYTLKVWNAAHKLVEQKVTVPASGEAKVTVALND